MVHVLNFLCKRFMKVKDVTQFTASNCPELIAFQPYSVYIFEGPLRALSISKFSIQQLMAVACDSLILSL